MDTCRSSRLVRITAVGYCKHRDDTLAVIDDVEGTVVAAPGCPDVVKRRIQGLAQPVWVLGNWASQVFIKGGAAGRGSLSSRRRAAGVKKIV
jgi:hypothetical protein